MRDVSAALVALLLGAAAACSAASPRPPILADCQASDAAGCSTQIAGSGGGPGDDSGAAVSCAGSDLSGSSQCTQCAGLRCCASLTTCFQSTDCQNLLNCEEGCGAVATCIDNCASQFPSATATFNELETCLRGMCTVCGESGIGDPCGGAATGCATGLTCVEGWCSEACTSSSTCAGLGPDGTNAVGLANACLTIAGTGDVCVPSCTTDSDCTDFAGTFCFTTTAVGGNTVQVCARAADAGP
jgi:hypothetical protein